MAFDPATGRLRSCSAGTALGAQQGSSTTPGPRGGTTWDRHQPGTVPPARYGASMAFNPASGRLLLFGGWGKGFDGARNDSWNWNGANWNELHAGHRAPRPLRGVDGLRPGVWADAAVRRHGEHKRLARDHLGLGPGDALQLGHQRDAVRRAHHRVGPA